jgi:hypothetical protein
MIKANSYWTNHTGQEFIVLHIIDDSQGHTWVHYRPIDSAREFSCYADSFLERFTAIENHRYT